MANSLRCKLSETCIKEVTWKFFLTGCKRAGGTACSSRRGAYVPAYTVCRQKLDPGVILVTGGFSKGFSNGFEVNLREESCG